MASKHHPEFSGINKGNFMKQLIFALSALALLATAIPADAGQCQTRCNNVGSQQVCNTYCW
jgi:hypothetical protein